MRVVLGILGWGLALVGLVLLSLLAVPFGYRLRFEGDTRRRKELFAELRLFWLFGLFALTLSLDKGRGSRALTLFGVRLGGRKGKARTGKEAEDGQEDGLAQEDPVAAEDQKVEENPREEAPDVPGASDGAFSQTPDAAGEWEKDLYPEPDFDQDPDLTDGEPGEGRADRGGLLAGGKRALQKIRKVKGVLGEETVKKGLRLVLEGGVRLIGLLLPKKGSGSLCFGLEDPADTGTVLALLGAVSALYRPPVQIRPDLETEGSYAAGHAWLRGRIFGAAVLAVLLRLLCDRSFWRMVKRVRRVKEEG